MSTAQAAAAQVSTTYDALASFEGSVRSALLASGGLPIWTTNLKDEDLIAWAVTQATSGVSEGLGYTIEAAHLVEAVGRESVLGTYRKSDVYLAIASDCARQADAVRDEGAKRKGVVGV